MGWRKRGGGLHPFFSTPAGGREVEREEEGRKREDRERRIGERMAMEKNKRGGREEGKEGEDNSVVSLNHTAYVELSKYAPCTYCFYGAPYYKPIAVFHSVIRCTFSATVTRGRFISDRLSLPMQPAWWSAFGQHTLQRDCISGVH